MLKATLFLIIILRAKCSEVIKEDGVNITDYCPNIGVCAEGTHIMCTHYNPKREMGPLCTGTEKVSITREYATTLLDLMNGIRSRTAKGLAVGFERKELPRGYGIFRLQWDPELARFAQLWANQCIIDYDMCHATKKFPDPGQVLVLTLFTEPDWLLLRKRDHFPPGFSSDKVRYSLESSVRSWYESKKAVDPDVILGRKWNNNMAKNPYLQIVQGSATHVGCGISAFKGYIYLTGSNDIIFNMVRLVCNFSTRIREGDVYTTKPSTEVGYTVKCGCPLGYDEDSDCLCYESGRGLPFSCRYGQCSPKLVVLPIFSVEPAPPHKLMKQLSLHDSNQKIKKEHCDLKQSYKNNKNSIFSKAMIFELPTRKLITRHTNHIAPEKIFTPNTYNTNSRKKASKNVYQTKTNQIHNNISDRRTSIFLRPFVKFKENNSKFDKEDTEDGRRKYNISKTVNIFDDSNNDNAEKSDRRTMDLLNMLEKEAENINLSEDKKIMLAARIRKIYQNFLQKSFNKTKNKFKFEYWGDLYKQESNVQDEFKANLNTDIHRNYSLNLKKGILFDNKFENMELKPDILNVKSIYLTNKVGNKHGIKMKINDSFDDDFLPLEKRIYYQKRLNDLKRRIHNLRNNGNMKRRQNWKADKTPHLNPMF